MNLANSAHASAMPERDLPARAFHLHLDKSTVDPRPAKTPFWFFFLMWQPACAASAPHRPVRHD